MMDLIFDLIWQRWLSFSKTGSADADTLFERVDSVYHQDQGQHHLNSETVSAIVVNSFRSRQD